MKKMLKMTVSVTWLSSALLILSACAVSPRSERPSWIDTPTHHQAVGSCGTHALGRYKQQECAMSRARLELAARKGVEISAVSVMTESATNLSSQSTLNGKVEQQVNNTIKTRLVDSYHDKAQDIIWVLLEEN